MFIYLAPEEGGSGWCVSSGVLDRVDGVISVDHHAFVEDTLDGGIADHYRVLNGTELARYKTDLQNGETLPHGWKAEKVQQIQKHPLKEDATLSFYCQCRTIELYIKPPPTSIASPETDWWLTPGKSTNTPVRYRAVHCVCESCRLCSGSVIQSWVYVPIEDVIDKRTSKPVVPTSTTGEDSVRMEGLVRYESSPGTFRESCGTCGAVVFFWKTSRDPMVLDISAGLIDQEQEGARAERWFAWREEVECPEDAIDKAGLKALEEGMRGWKDLYSVA